MALVDQRPLIEYTFDAAKGCRLIDAVWLSSDDPEILAFGASSGLRTLQRPAEIASDEASAVDVVNHFLATLPADQKEQDPLVVYLQPTSPLRTAKHIDEALQLLVDEERTCLLSVVEMAKSPFKAFRTDAEGKLQSLFDERLSNARRQDLPPTYLPNGAIYIFAVSDFEQRGGFPSNGSVPFVMTEHDSIDIDTRDDLANVEKIMRMQRG